jgi:predicted RNA-binding Zn-ribbon protein involved in translation (DUF1610 family)
MNFKVGQKVASLFTTCARKRGEVFTVTGSYVCPNCGDNLITFGVSHGFSSGESSNTCATCYKPTGFFVSEWCDNASTFVPVIENTSTADIANQIFETCNDVKEIKIPELV